MATSGTVTFNPDILELIEEASEMVGVEARVGYDLRSARRSLNMLMREWGNRGINMWTLIEEIYAYPANAVSINLPDDTIDVLDAAWRTGDGQAQQDRVISRYSISNWSQIANKNLIGTPSQYYVERTYPPKIQLWPLPNIDGTLVIWKLRSIQDAGNYTNTVDITPRFLPALTAGLAYYLALKNPAAASRIPTLQTEYERQFSLAAEEDRDRGSFFMVPDLSAYNR